MTGFSNITNWIHEGLSGLMAPWLAFLTELVIAVVAVILVIVAMVVVMVYMERKVAGFMQLRLGPHRVGIWGTLQVFADVFKLLLKESFAPNNVDKFLFNLAPMMVLAVFAVLLVMVLFALLTAPLVLLSMFALLTTPLVLLATLLTVLPVMVLLAVFALL